MYAHRERAVREKKCALDTETFGYRAVIKVVEASRLEFTSEDKKKKRK